MKSILHNPFLDIFFEEKKHCIILQWNKNTIHLENDEYKTLMSNFLDLCISHKAKMVLNDAQLSEFVISLEMQEWLQHHIFAPLIKIGLKKVAMVVSKEMITQISIEQVMEEEQGILFQTRFFDDTKEAFQWLD